MRISQQLCQVTATDVRSYRHKGVHNRKCRFRREIHASLRPSLPQSFGKSALRDARAKEGMVAQGCSGRSGSRYANPGNRFGILATDADVCPLLRRAVKRHAVWREESSFSPYHSSAHYLANNTRFAINAAGQRMAFTDLFKNLPARIVSTPVLRHATPRPRNYGHQ